MLPDTWPRPTNRYQQAPDPPGLSPLLAGIRNGAWLDAQEFPPLNYAVPGIIPEGLVLHVGPPKIGKSWLVLSIALARATGGYAIGLQVPQGPIFYLALEDGDRRMQDRCRKLLHSDPIPPAFEYQTLVEHGRVLDTIAAWLELQTDPALVILDTLGKVMPPALNGESGYQRDYRVGSALKQLADAHPGTAILVNHHDRKASAEDFVDSVSGTHGLAGAADTIVVVTRPRLEEDGLIKVTGRDVPEGEYAVRFRDGHHWTLNGRTLEEAAQAAVATRATAGLGDRQAEIVAYVIRHPDSVVTTAQVAQALDLDPGQARVYLNRAADADRIVRAGRGRWTSHPPVTSVTTVTEEEEDPSVRNSRNSRNTSNTPSGGRLLPFDSGDPARFTR